MKKKELIDTIGDLICLIGLFFFIAVCGTYILPLIQESAQLCFSISILLSDIYVAKIVINKINFIIDYYKK